MDGDEATRLCLGKGRKDAATVLLVQCTCHGVASSRQTGRRIQSINPSFSVSVDVSCLLLLVSHHTSPHLCFATSRRGRFGVYRPINLETPPYIALPTTYYILL